MMKQKQAYIAYTIIVERDDGKPMFLIDNDETYFGFPAVESIKDQSGLSIIIDELKRTLKNIDFGRIELSELTNKINVATDTTAKAAVIIKDIILLLILLSNSLSS